MEPDERRSAVRVDDHPLEYFAFEGVIPAGQYGAGDVTIWDWGTYEPADGDGVTGAVERGRLTVRLAGHRLRGTFVLERAGDRGARERWTIVRAPGDTAAPHGGRGSRSVRSGRSPDEIRDLPHAMWDGHAAADDAEVVLAATTDELDALGALEGAGEWRVGGHPVRLTNLDKVLFPDGTTKRDLVRHYATVAPILVPHLRDRASNLHRYPDGVGAGRGFWQKDLPARTPTWVRRWPFVHQHGGRSVYPVIDRVATLAWLAQEAAVEIHPWTSSTDAPDHPTAALIDIDPGESTSWDEVLVLARLFRTALEHLGVVGVPKVTGRRGIQVAIPIAHGPTFEDTRAWVEGLSRAVGATVPDLVSWAWSKGARGGRARLDYTQNAQNRTLVAPYSVRSSPIAAVATPIRWSELDDPNLRPDGWTIHTIIERIADVGDLSAPMAGTKQRLPPLG
jgi:bifunctional non-homologous end joining protein LigD